jgi:hypothetical protein
MSSNDTSLTPPTPATSEERHPIRDLRQRPLGVMPRQLQTWIMAGLTAALLAIIVVTGRPTAPRSIIGAPQASTSLSPDRLRQYQKELAEQEARLRREIADNQAAAAAANAAPRAGEFNREPTADPMHDEQRRRAYSSLFADNVAFTRRRDGGAGTPAAGAPKASDLGTPGPEEVIARAFARARHRPRRRHRRQSSSPHRRRRPARPRRPSRQARATSRRPFRRTRRLA